MANMYHFPPGVPVFSQGRRSKILVPSGALLVWDSRLPHENFPNEGEDWRIVPGRSNAQQRWELPLFSSFLGMEDDL